ncbi:MAG TPA: glycosyltransferase family 4 protein [Candidatus Krumholzibacteria bacterium]
MRVLFLNKYTARGPSSRYRVLQFLPFLDARGIQASVHALHDDHYLQTRYSGAGVTPVYLARRTLSRLSTLAGASRYDLVFIQKELFPHLPGVPEGWMARRGIRYVVDLDDAIHLLYTRAGGWRGALRHKIPRILARASLVLAGNRYLEAYARQHTDRVLYFPTVVDTARFTPAAPRDGAASVLGWMGTPDTVKYLHAITPALEDAARRAPLSLLVVGAEAPSLSALECRAKPWSEAGEADDLRAMDIGLMPLSDDEWSKGKCALKLLQYMSAGVASVTSPSGSAPEFVRDGDNAFLAVGEAQWRDRVLELASSPAVRARMGGAARATVEAKYSLSMWGPRFADALLWAAGVESAAPVWGREGAARRA